MILNNKIQPKRKQKSHIKPCSEGTPKIISHHSPLFLQLLTLQSRHNGNVVFHLVT